MNEHLRDYDLKSTTSQPDSSSRGPETPRWPWILVVALVIIGLVAFFWFRAEKPEEATPIPEPAAAAEPAEPEVRTSELVLGEVPALADSDAWLQGVVGQISSHPQLAEWLLTPELIRGFVVVVDNIAEGVSPRKHLEVAAPTAKFGVETSGERIYVDPASYERYDLLIDVVESLDEKGTAQLYRAIRPMCEQAYQDLGYSQADFEPALARAVQQLLETPVITRPIELEKRVSGYSFADPELESLSPAAKHFLRLGPDNLQRLQRKVRALATAIGLEGVS